VSSFLAKKLDKHMTKRDFQATEYRAESYAKHLENRVVPDTVGEEPDLVERLKGVPDRLAKEALDEIVRLRSEAVSLQSGVQFWCNQVHRMMDK